MAMVSNLISKTGPLGLYALARLLCRKHPRILMYHRFSTSKREGHTSADAFRKQLEYVVRHLRPMALRDLVRAVYEEGRVPTNAVVITIDDGYRDFYEVAFPLLQEFEVPATLFVTTGFISGDFWLWPDQVRYLLNNTNELHESKPIGPVNLEPGPLSAINREDYWSDLVSFLLSVSEDDKQRWINELSSELGTQLPSTAPDEYAPVSWEQLREMEACGIEVGGHTVTHPSLGRVTRERAEFEVRSCMTALNANLQALPRTFCFPNGQPADCPETVKKLVAESGFIGSVVAFADDLGMADRYAMRRHSSGEDQFQFAKAVSGVEYLGFKARGTRHSLPQVTQQPA